MVTRSRLSKLFHFITDRHRETPRMLLHPPMTWEVMRELMQRFQIDAPYPWQRRWVLEALRYEVPVIADPHMPRNQMFLINPMHVVVVPPESAPWAQCAVPW